MRKEIIFDYSYFSHSFNKSIRWSFKRFRKSGAGWEEKFILFCYHNFEENMCVGRHLVFPVRIFCYFHFTLLFKKFFDTSHTGSFYPFLTNQHSHYYVTEFYTFLKTVWTGLEIETNPWRSALVSQNEMEKNGTEFVISTKSKKLSSFFRFLYGFKMKWTLNYEKLDMIWYIWMNIWTKVFYECINIETIHTFINL